jgi:ABC-type branched-subunit amino acid transport system permease subunit
MVRDRLKSWIRDQSTGVKVGVLVAALIGAIVARQMAFVLEGAGTLMIILGGLPTIVLFIGSVYVGALVLITLVRDIRGESQTKADPS